MRRFVLLAVVIAGCNCNHKQATLAQVSAGSAAVEHAATTPKKLDDAAISARFTELRDDRALGCLLERTEKPNTTSPVLQSMVEHSRSNVIARIVAFALVERARAEGESVELAAIADAVHELGPVGDVDGLKMLFARVDQISGVTPNWFDTDEAYRARVVRDLPASVRTRGHLEWVTQTAMAGQVKLAEAIYEREVSAEDRARASTEHVSALAALGRDAKVRELVATVNKRARAELVEAWLKTVAQMRKPLADVTSEMVREIERDPDAPYPTPETRRLVGRVEPAAAARLRKAEMAAWTPEYLQKHPGAVEAVYLDVLTSSGVHDAERAAIEAIVPPELRTRAQTLHARPLDDALAFALAQKHRDDALAIVWARAVVEDPAFLEKLAAKVCTTPQPKIATPTPAATALELVVTSKLRAKQAECDRTDVLVRLKNGPAIADEQLLEGRCTGACTAAEKREGKRQIAEIERRIARGESTTSELDYNFTECQFSGHREGRLERIGDRKIALLEHISIGPHDVPQRSYQLAFEVCGKLFVSAAFGGRYAGGWRLEDLKLAPSPDGREIRVRGESDTWRGFLYRATLPACPDSPIEKVNAHEL